MTVFLYEVKRKVELTLRESAGTVNWNLPMNSNDFRVFKDSHNTIEFVVRNTDRKPINLMGRSVQINLYDQRTSKLMFNSKLRITNEAKGIAVLDITPDVTADWFIQTYSYSVVVTNSDGSRHMLYVDEHEGQRGFFELSQGPKFDPFPSYEVEWEALMQTAETPNNTRTSYRYSSAFPGSLQRNNTAGLHSAVVYLENFSGELKIQGSVEEGDPAESDWYDIQVLEFDKTTGLQNVSWEANLMWVRFFVRSNGDNHYDALDVNTGKITKLVFRN